MDAAKQGLRFKFAHLEPRVIEGYIRAKSIADNEKTLLQARMLNSEGSGPDLVCSFGPTISCQDPATRTLPPGREANLHHGASERIESPPPQEIDPTSPEQPSGDQRVPYKEAVRDEDVACLWFKALEESEGADPGAKAALVHMRTFVAVSTMTLRSSTKAETCWLPRPS